MHLTLDAGEILPPGYGRISGDQVVEAVCAELDRRHGTAGGWHVYEVTQLEPCPLTVPHRPHGPCTTYADHYYAEEDE